MCTAKARIAKCGHTVEYEILIPCANWSGSGPPCAAWDENLLNQVLLTDYALCVACHLLKERKICRRYVDAERDLVRVAVRSRDGTPEEVWEARLRNGVKMQAVVLELDAEAGRVGSWREGS